jgi:hypothetical protein
MQKGKEYSSSIPLPSLVNRILDAKRFLKGTTDMNLDPLTGSSGSVDEEPWDYLCYSFYSLKRTTNERGMAGKWRDAKASRTKSNLLLRPSLIEKRR